MREPRDDQRDRDPDRGGDHPDHQHLHERALTHRASLEALVHHFARHPMRSARRTARSAGEERPPHDRRGRMRRRRIGERSAQAVGSATSGIVPGCGRVYDCGNRCKLAGDAMHVREGMSEVVLTVGPGHTLREAAAAMCRRNVGRGRGRSIRTRRARGDHRARHPALGRRTARTPTRSWSPTT